MAQNLAQLLKDAGITQKALADEFGVEQATISRRLKNNWPEKEKDIRRLSKFTGIHPRLVKPKLAKVFR